MRGRVLKTAAAIVLGLALLAALVVGGGWIYLRRSLPRIAGTIRVDGIGASIEIVRDRDAVPHIFASSKRDALFGLGYVHAQDRLWQMEFQRRIGHGRLSEIFGDATIPQDRFLRTVGFGRAARAAWERLPADAREQIDAYVAGVNAFLSGHRGSRLPPEFTLLRFAPEPWTGVDVLVWIKMMAWDLSANYQTELLRGDIQERLGRERMNDLFFPYALGALNIVPSSTGAEARAPGVPPAEPVSSPSSASLASDAFARALAMGHPSVQTLLGGGAGLEAIGSNNWVVDGTLTKSGKPLLANDPHLATQIPSIWYLAHMSAGTFDVIGATLPGAPAVALGRNRDIAWGATNVAADVQDLYRERLDPSGTAAEYQGTMEPLRLITEEITVSGGPSVSVTVRVSRHGPLVSDAINANNAPAPGQPRPPQVEPLAFRWTALDDDDATVVAFLALNEARDWRGFTDALRHLVAPSQHFVFADAAGHIGYYAPGRIPIRARGNGAVPSEGWTGAAEWTGWIPFENLPHLYDPPQHFIVTANHRALPGDDPRFVGLEYPEPYRAQRIIDLLGQGRPFTTERFREIQADTLSLHARTLLPVLLEHVSPADDVTRRGVEILRQWNFDASGESAAAAIFQAWFLELAPALAGDELGDRLLDRYRSRFSFITRFVLNTLNAPYSRWCDNVKSALVETCNDQVAAALGAGLATLTRELGGDMAAWRWNAVHRAVFPHQGLDAVAALRPILNRTHPSGGDWSTVNVGPVAADHPFEQRSVPGYRQIVDLSPEGESRFLDAVGQSGHFLSPRYDDALSDWSAVRPRPMRMDRAAVDQGAIGTLTLAPASAP